MEWFCVPLFSKTLTLLVWRGPLGSAQIFYHPEIIYFFDELSHFEKADSNLATVNPCLVLTRRRTSNSGSRTPQRFMSPHSLCRSPLKQPVLLQSVAHPMQCAWQASAGIGRVGPPFLDDPIPSLMHLDTHPSYTWLHVRAACATVTTEILDGMADNKKITIAAATIAGEFIVTPPNPLALLPRTPRATPRKP